MKKIGILSDTHGYLHPKIFDFFASCDEIWHAGDIVNSDLLTELETIAKVRAVFGNCDGWEYRGKIPETNIFMCEEHKIMLKHIVGKPNYYDYEALQTIISEKPTIVVAGHSHILRIIHDNKYNHLFINPGAAGRYGIHTRLTFMRLEIDGKNISNVEIWDEPKQQTSF